jgi:hypothetical protein
MHKMHNSNFTMVVSACLDCKVDSFRTVVALIVAAVVRASIQDHELPHLLLRLRG